MEILVARQPIYNKRLKVFAYELLYRRPGGVNYYTGQDGDKATASVIAGAFMSIGMQNLTGKKLGFINFTANHLTGDIIDMLPREYVGVEILEDISSTPDVLTACARLKEAGYSIILDDFALTPESEKFIQYADIIKMDFLQSSDEQLKDIVQKYKATKIKFLAEKIETKEVLLKAIEYGYSYFQGYYFSKPQIISRNDVLPLQINILKILEAAYSGSYDIDHISKIIRYDPGMTYKVLQLANSVIYKGVHKITKINVALARIGMADFRKWVLFVSMQGLNSDKPDELIKQSIIRAKIAEDLCVKLRLGTDSDAFSMLGLLSLLDTITDRPMESLLESIRISSPIKTALINPGEDIYSIVIRLISAYDNGDWSSFEMLAQKSGISSEEYSQIWLSAVTWCDENFSTLSSCV